MLTENMKMWLQQMYRNEAKEQRGTAENCHIFALGSDTQEDAEQFEQFAEEHREFANILDAMADELDEDSNSSKSQYPCDYLSDCPYNATGGYDCRNFCGLGVDEDEEDYEDDVDDWGRAEIEYEKSSSNGDYGPSNPWGAPGMKISDFI